MISELQTLDTHEHPHIVRVLDLCEDNKNIYIVSELIRHGTLDENLNRIKKAHASVSEQDCANIVYQILSAVNFLHL